MAFKDTSHRARVVRSPEFQRMLRDFNSSGAPVPVHVFIRAYSNAFWNENGNPIRPGDTNKSKKGFMDIMEWSGRWADPEEGWDAWEEYEEG